MEEPEDLRLDPAVLRCPLDLLPLSSAVAGVLRNTFFFTHATSIQQKAIPVFLRPATDIVVEACTGSGKTLAFLVPIAERLLRYNDENIQATGRPHLTKRIQALVLSPSKNLSRQTFRVCQRLLASLPHNLKCFLWGDGRMEGELEAFKRCARGGGNILVSHPESLLQRLRAAKRECSFRYQFLHSGHRRGRRRSQDRPREAAGVALAHSHTIGHGAVRCDVHVFPRDGGFVKRHLGEVVHLDAEESAWDEPLEGIDYANGDLPTPKTLVSAELLETLCPADGQRRCVMIRDKTSTQVNLSNRFMWVKAEDKLSTLMHLIKVHSTKKHFVFFNNSECLEYVGNLLDHMGEDGARLLGELPIYRVHGELKESQKLVRFRKFVEDTRGILLCTDASFAFGLDIRHVDYVLHFDVPREPRVYVHRVGRTARMGTIGTSVMFLPAERKAELTAPGGYLAQLNDSLAGEEVKAPVMRTVFNLLPLIRGLLSFNPSLLQCAREALSLYAAELAQPRGDNPEPLAAADFESQMLIAMRSLGLDLQSNLHMPTYMDTVRSKLEDAPASRDAPMGAVEAKPSDTIPEVIKPTSLPDLHLPKTPSNAPDGPTIKRKRRRPILDASHHQQVPAASAAGCPTISTTKTKKKRMITTTETPCRVTS
eukprot:TRINITY_DN14043_c0_g1_i1.p1 TRINITY_DN14043_c0_g1~~TRINITY_DN14043_c0_g1_i1.p1  ORF type:complete len:660 (-),score=150.61 TRINITY_DN14043_c0_g1_i1:99-2057(-)